VNVAGLQQAAQQHPVLHQEHLGIKAEEQAKIQRDQVQNIEKDAEATKVEEDKKGSSGAYFAGSGKGGHKEEEGVKEGGKGLDPNLGRFIDVVK
jgi:hypothetical protein